MCSCSAVPRCFLAVSHPPSLALTLFLLSLLKCSLCIVCVLNMSVCIYIFIFTLGMVIVASCGLCVDHHLLQRNFSGGGWQVHWPLGKQVIRSQCKSVSIEEHQSRFYVWFVQWVIHLFRSLCVEPYSPQLDCSSLCILKDVLQYIHTYIHTCWCFTYVTAISQCLLRYIKMPVLTELSLLR